MNAPRAYYNEHDTHAAEWLRNLIAAGEIAPGDVDERDIRDVLPAELGGYRQCHFFAGIGIWSRALRTAGWPDDRPVWTGSCPCQPFSAAGAALGFDDERHLWPHWHWLIEQHRPQTVFGEQVASSDGLGWADLVSADLEAAGYACGFVDTCAAGFRSYHIRQRLYFAATLDGPAAVPGYADTIRRFGGVVDSLGAGSQGYGRDGRDRDQSGRLGTLADGSVAATGGIGGMGNAGRKPGERDAGGVSGAQTPPAGARGRDGRHGDGHSDASASGGLADMHGDGRSEAGPSISKAGHDGIVGNSTALRVADQPGDGCGEERPDGAGPGSRERAQGRAAGSGAGGASRRLADSDGSERRAGSDGGPTPDGQTRGRVKGSDRIGECDDARDDILALPSDGYWRDADWLFCRDGVWRPVGPSHVEMADENSSRVGRVRSEGPAKTKEVRSRDDLSVMQETSCREAVFEREKRVSVDVEQAEVLRPGVHGCGAGKGNLQQPQSQSSEGERDDQGTVRELPGGSQPASASQGREPAEQRPLELDDVVPLLSLSLSLAEQRSDHRTEASLSALRQAIREVAPLQHASQSVEEIWASLGKEEKDRVRVGVDASRWKIVAPFPLTKSTYSRMGRLRAYGNGLDLAQATGFVRAFLERDMGKPVAGDLFEFGEMSA